LSGCFEGPIEEVDVLRSLHLFSQTGSSFASSSLAVLSLIMVLASAGCGDRATGLTGDAGVGRDSATLADGRPPLNSPCAIGIRVDNCCTVPQAVTEAELAADLCLVRWPVRSVPKACAERMPKVCETVDCAMAAPPSRVTAKRPDGSCAFANECETAADCAVAYNARVCCGCGSVWPASVVAADPCLDAQGPANSSWPPQTCKEACLAQLLCEPCPSAWPEPRCVSDPEPGALAICR
jgi:hypothetical protein